MRLAGSGDYAASRNYPVYPGFTLPALFWEKCVLAGESPGGVISMKPRLARVVCLCQHVHVRMDLPVSVFITHLSLQLYFLWLKNPGVSFPSSLR